MSRAIGSLNGDLIDFVLETMSEDEYQTMAREVFGEDLSDQTIQASFENLDKDHDGQLSFDGKCQPNGGILQSHLSISSVLIAPIRVYGWLYEHGISSISLEESGMASLFLPLLVWWIMIQLIQSQTFIMYTARCLSKGCTH